MAKKSLLDRKIDARERLFLSAKRACKDGISAYEWETEILEHELGKLLPYKEIDAITRLAFKLKGE